MVKRYIHAHFSNQIHESLTHRAGGHHPPFTQLRAQGVQSKLMFVIFYESGHVTTIELGQFIAKRDKYLTYFRCNLLKCHQRPLL